jgi:hypothetical protein
VPGVKEAIISFAQSEKVKAGLIWASQIIEILWGLPDEEKKGTERILQLFLNMISREIALAKTITRHESWDSVDGHIEKALVMISSGVGQEAVVHLSRALSLVTNIAQQSMSFLKERDLL